MSGSAQGFIGFWIECRDCPAAMEGDTEEAIVTAWNTRALIERLNSELERIREALRPFAKLELPPAERSRQRWIHHDDIQRARAALHPEKDQCK